MSIKLYWDTETTGLREPWLMEFAGLLVDDADNEVWRAHGLVKLPGHVVIEAGAFAVHNITHEMCETEGIEPAVACAIFAEQCARADMIVGQFLQYDLDVMVATAQRCGVERTSLPRIVELTNWTTPLCQLPPTGKMLKAGRNHYKTPNLAEAMRIICGVEHIGHRALPDILACRQLHRTIKEKLDEKAEKTTTAPEESRPGDEGAGPGHGTPERGT